MDSSYVDQFPLGYQKAIAITPKITGFLSMMGCSWIIFEVLTDKRKRQSMYHRILLCLSVSELNCSFWTYFLSSWMLPQGTSFFGASGNWATCNVQGFMFQVDIATPLYNAVLSLYYLLLLRYNWTPKQMAKRIEPYLHAFILTFAFATATAPLFLTLYNPTINSWCSVTEYPYHCENSSATTTYGSGIDSSVSLSPTIEINLNDTEKIISPSDEQSMEQLYNNEPSGSSSSSSMITDGSGTSCVRGRSQQYAAFFSWLMEFLPIWLVIVFTTVNMALVYYTVRHQERKMERRYKFHGLAIKRSRQQPQQGQQKKQLSPSRRNCIVGTPTTRPSASPDGGASELPSPRPSILSWGTGMLLSPVRRQKQSQLQRRQQQLQQRQRQRKKQRESERILTICILYTSSFYATFGCYTVLEALKSIQAFEQISNPTLIFAMVMLSNICLPLEGFFVCLIYLYPRYQRYKEQRAKKRLEEYNQRQELLNQKHHHSSVIMDSANQLRIDIPVDSVVDESTTRIKQQQSESIDDIDNHDDDSVYMNRHNNRRNFDEEISIHNNDPNASVGIRYHCIPWQKQHSQNVLRLPVSGVSSLAHSTTEQPNHNESPCSSPRRTSWYAKVPILSLVDWKSLGLTIRRGWNHNNGNDDDDHRLGCEVLSILSILSTDANGDLPSSPEQRLSMRRPKNNTNTTNSNNNSSAPEGEMVGTVIQFDTAQGATEQFRNLSIIRDSVRTTTSTSGKNFNLLEELRSEDDNDDADGDVIQAVSDENGDDALLEDDNKSYSSKRDIFIDEEEGTDGASTTKAVHA